MRNLESGREEDRKKTFHLLFNFSTAILRNTDYTIFRMILQPFLHSMALLRLAFLIVVVSLPLVWAKPAVAAFLFCNKTKSVIEAAFGRREDNLWLSEGWWQIQPGQCARVYGKALTQRFYFFYARALTVPGKEQEDPKVWSGKYAFCTDSKAFRAQGDSNCEMRGFQTKGFQEVDVGVRQKNYTLTFEDTEIH